ncbi:hypothetical protein ACVWYK_002363 [Bradyrhizobium sp. USDA 4470]
MSPKKVKSEVSEELSQGTCAPLVVWLTARRTRLNNCSIGTLGSRAMFRKACV